MPRLFTTPFASGGDKVVVPDAPQPDGSVSYSEGYTLDYELENTDPDYKPVPREGMNGLFYDLTDAVGAIQAKGLTAWSNLINYTTPAIVFGGDGLPYMATQASGPATAPRDPVSEPAYWKLLGTGSTTVSMSGSNVTLTAVQAFEPVIIITGTLTANVQLIFPTYTKQWMVINSTSGNFTITCKTAAGTGIALETTGRAVIACDGTNIVGALNAASQAQTDAGTLDNVAVTPKKIRSGFSISLTANGWIKLPSWLGGWIIQWIHTTALGTQGASSNWPLTFPTACLFAGVFCQNGSSVQYATIGARTTTTVTAFGSAVPINIGFIGIGH